jgi:hypothetical protein
MYYYLNDDAIMSIAGMAGGGLVFCLGRRISDLYSAFFAKSVFSTK